MPDSLLSKMPVAGSQVKIYTYFSVREDAMQLFGFATQADKDLFKLLITVSGIGPKGGLALMGTLPEMIFGLRSFLKMPRRLQLHRELERKQPKNLFWN